MPNDDIFPLATNTNYTVTSTTISPSTNNTINISENSNQAKHFITENLFNF